MTDVWTKSVPGAPDGYCEAEAAGLRWLAAAGGARVVTVLDVAPDRLQLERLVPSSPDRAAAAGFGAALATTHVAGAGHHGAAPDSWDGPGFFGPADEPLPAPYGHYPAWGEFLADARLAPATELGRRRGDVDADAADVLERLADRLRAGDYDDDAAPSRVHGDLWSGNLLWTAEGAVLIDPAAHGGHALEDLGMLHLFGAPHLDAIGAAYAEAAGERLRPDWQELIGLAQVYPLLMHAILFGGAYLAQTIGVARRYL